MPTPNLGLPYLENQQANKETQHNKALSILDALVQGRVIDRDLSSPPGSPTNGAAYIVAASASGAWSTHETHIAYWLTEVGIWQFVVPLAGWRVYVIDEAISVTFNGSAWSTSTQLVLNSATDNITANAVQTQVGAYALVTQCGRITTCATTGDSVRIDFNPIVGAQVEIRNDGVNAAWIWPDTGMAIDGGATNARDTNALAAGSTRRYRCFTAGVWRTV